MNGSRSDNELTISLISLIVLLTTSTEPTGLLNYIPKWSELEFVNQRHLSFNVVLSTPELPEPHTFPYRNMRYDTINLFYMIK
jgi:hypothetical protein